MTDNRSINTRGGNYIEQVGRDYIEIHHGDFNNPENKSSYKKFQAVVDNNKFILYYFKEKSQYPFDIRPLIYGFISIQLYINERQDLYKTIENNIKIKKKINEYKGYFNCESLNIKRSYKLTLYMGFNNSEIRLFIKENDDYKEYDFEELH